MLPFLKYKRKETGVAVQHMGETTPMMKYASDLLKAIESKDERAVADAFEACFKCCEKEPHEEADESSDDKDEAKE